MTNSRIPYLAGFIAVASLACSSSSSKPEQVEGPPVSTAAAGTRVMPETMTFRWPKGGVVRVAEASEKKGVKSETAYDLHICPTDEGLIIHYRDFRFVSLGGIPADDPRVRDQVQQALPFVRLIPDLKVAADGRLVQLVGLKEAMRAVNESFTDPTVRKAMDNLLANPNMIAMIEAKSSEIWSAWVGVWALFEPRGGAKQSFTTEIPVPDGTANRAFDIERVAVEGPRLRLRVTKLEGNDELKEILMQILKPVIAAAPDSKEAQKMLSKARIRRATTWNVLTDPKSLRPSEVETEMKLSLSIPGDSEKSRYERHVYKFDWAATADAVANCPE